MDFSVGEDEYSDSEIVMPTAEIMYFSERKMSDTFHFLCEINQGYMNNCSEKYFHGRQNNLVSEYSRWYAAKKKKNLPFQRKCVWGHSFTLDELQHIRGNVIIKNSFHSSWLSFDSQLHCLSNVFSIWAFWKYDGFIICYISKVRASKELQKLSQSSRKTWIKHAYPEF